jgi:hypothetical protein
MESGSKLSPSPGSVDDATPLAVGMQLRQRAANRRSYEALSADQNRSRQWLVKHACRFPARHDVVCVAISLLAFARLRLERQ